jgi:phosphatidylinositol kinase/protein kinase (PI-3  family)
MTPPLLLLLLLKKLFLLLQVNALLAKDRRTNRHDLSIQRYAVTPLSHNVGIVGWVPHCDTLHALIRDYRESRRILLNIEHRLMTQVSSSGYMHACTLSTLQHYTLSTAMLCTYSLLCCNWVLR